MISKSRKFIHFSDNVYEVRYVFSELSISSISELQSFLGSDIALRREGKVYFCEKVQEAEFVED
jgi:hypothetical protein